MSGGDNTSARAVDIRIAGQLTEMVEKLAALTVSETLAAGQRDLETALAAIAKRIRDREATT